MRAVFQQRHTRSLAHHRNALSRWKFVFLQCPRCKQWNQMRAWNACWALPPAIPLMQRTEYQMTGHQSKMNPRAFRICFLTVIVGPSRGFVSQIIFKNQELNWTRQEMFWLFVYTFLTLFTAFYGWFLEQSRTQQKIHVSIILQQFFYIYFQITCCYWKGGDFYVFKIQATKFESLACKFWPFLFGPMRYLRNASHQRVIKATCAEKFKLHH